LDWQIPLLVSAIAFAAFLIFKMRPAWTPAARVSATALVEAKRRIESAKDDPARAIALADAADACATLGRMNSAVGFYLRALRADPCSAQVVERTAKGLARRPTSLELLMWRHLAAHPWTAENRPASIASLRALAGIYRRRRRQHVRAQAIEHALEALGAGDSAR
jgi:hypothetical protein